MANYTCPHCNKQVKDLKGHIARMHPEHADNPPDDQENNTEVNEDAEDLEITAPESKGQHYHCVDCGGDITRGQNPCPHCGATLDWSAVQ